MFERVVNEEPVREIEPLIFCIMILIFNPNRFKSKTVKKIKKSLLVPLRWTTKKAYNNKWLHSKSDKLIQLLNHQNQPNDLPLSFKATSHGLYRDFY